EVAEEPGVEQPRRRVEHRLRLGGDVVGLFHGHLRCAPLDEDDDGTVGHGYSVSFLVAFLVTPPGAYQPSSRNQCGARGAAAAMVVTPAWNGLTSCSVSDAMAAADVAGGVITG